MQNDQFIKGIGIEYPPSWKTVTDNPMDFNYKTQLHYVYEWLEYTFTKNKCNTTNTLNT